MPVTLQPMTAERYVSWNERLIVEFAKEKVDSGNWPAEGALERSARENAADLPRGLETPGHDIFVGLVDGEEVGVLWLFTDPAHQVPETMIYDIEIAEEHRGKGLGRELLTAAEEWCADHSIGLLKLHVFAHNTTAVSLYESAGFEATNINMAKVIR
ncbi:GNAT family N-acetyltransferase [Aeromicrobium panaciterrae]|uniref:GNAT family N-acetyltransferase n=1 Tax=Aeromicrobium panaciterrae TaxID=363861 RepID=UPI0031D2E377